MINFRSDMIYVRRNFLFRKRIAVDVAEISSLPKFLYFNKVEFSVEKLQKAIKFFNPLTQLFGRFDGVINGSAFSFESDEISLSYGTLINNLVRRLLPIFDSCLSYEFTIAFNEGNFASNFVTRILLISSIMECSNVAFELSGFHYSMELPVWVIIKWLHNDRASKNERILAIQASSQIENCGEMLLDLIKVKKISVF